MENFKSKFQENKKFIIVLTLCILLSLLTVLFIYKYKNKDKIHSEGSSTLNTIISLVEEINNSNNKLNDCLSGFTINSETALNILNDNIVSLDNIQSSLRSMILTDDYSREASSKIMSSIESTQNLYNYCIYTLSLDNTYELSDCITKIDELEYNLLNNYEELNALGLSIKFEDDSPSFLNNLRNYLISKENINKSNQIKVSQATDFLKDFKSYITDFSNILQDLEPAITQAREDKRSFDPILDDIYDKEIAFKNIKDKINSLSIPEGYLSYYKSFNEVSNLYSNYLKALKVAIVYEKSSDNYTENKDNIDKNYDNAYSKYQDVKDSLDSLIKSLENL